MLSVFTAAWNLTTIAILFTNILPCRVFFILLLFLSPPIQNLFCIVNSYLSDHDHQLLLATDRWVNGILIHSYHSFGQSQLNHRKFTCVHTNDIPYIYFCSRSSAVGKALHHESIKGSVNLVLELFEENQPIRPQIVCQLWQVDFFQLNSIKRSYNSDRLLLWIQKVPFPNFGALFS